MFTAGSTSPKTESYYYGPVKEAYQKLICSGSVRRDETQLLLASKLDELHQSLATSDSFVFNEKQLDAYTKLVEFTHDTYNHNYNHTFRSLLSSSTAAKLLSSFHSSEIMLTRPYHYFTKHQPPQGLYIHGSVGVGKSFLMDIFYDVCGEGSTTKNRKRKRVHFHEFMLNVHDRIHQYKKLYPKRDVIPLVAFDLAKESRLLCFDEFQVTDIADAMIIKRLFTILFRDFGVIVVATSNRPPNALYEGGLNRAQFVPFIDECLTKFCSVFPMTNSHHDYRRDNYQKKNYKHHQHQFSSYFWKDPSSSVADLTTEKKLNEIFLSCGDGDGSGNTITTLTATSDSSKKIVVPVMMGRSILVSKSNGHCGWFNFEELCCRPLGAADYISLSNRFSVIIVENVPQLGANEYNEARRFITFIDALYESKTRLVISASVPIEHLFVGFDAEVQSSDGDEEIAVASLEEKGKNTVVDDNGDVNNGKDSIKNSQNSNEKNFEEEELRTQQQQGSSYVSGKGGSSSSFSTTMIRTKDGDDVEWSATGRIGVSLAQLSAVKDVAFSFKRAESRLVEMSSDQWIQKNYDKQHQKHSHSA